MACSLPIRKHNWCSNKPQILYPRILNNCPNMSSLCSPASKKATGHAFDKHTLTTHHRKTNSVKYLAAERPSPHYICKWQSLSKTVTKHLYTVPCWCQLSGHTRLLLVRAAPGCNQPPVRNNFFPRQLWYNIDLLHFPVVVYTIQCFYRTEGIKEQAPYSWIFHLLFPW